MSFKITLSKFRTWPVRYLSFKLESVASKNVQLALPVKKKYALHVQKEEIMPVPILSLALIVSNNVRFASNASNVLIVTIRTITNYRKSILFSIVSFRNVKSLLNNIKISLRSLLIVMLISTM